MKGSSSKFNNKEGLGYSNKSKNYENKKIGISRQKFSHENKTCLYCEQKGHIRYKCPYRGKRAQTRNLIWVIKGSIPTNTKGPKMTRVPIKTT